ncbi:MAG TPA: protein-glutamate O-methyltransferase CheR [Bryobacteraceae bacterium]|nr:protein-glutamate O-methyltransferase CheR [Bryobacteraceae bacterium]
MAQTLAVENLKFLQERVYAHSGIVLDESKGYLIDARLSPIVRQLQLESINDLCELLRATARSPIETRVVEAMTTNETYFFRENEHYIAIREKLIPQLQVSRQATRQMRFLSAACSTGQEAYSLIMLLLDMGLGTNWNLSVLGTDISNPVLDRARAGRYQQIEVSRGLPAPALVRYFRHGGADWEIKEEVRRRAEFRLLDLRDITSRVGPFDAIFCRNVLIYFDAATRKRILARLHSCLAAGGWLILGGAENCRGTEDLFRRQNVGKASVFVSGG